MKKISSNIHGRVIALKANYYIVETEDFPKKIENFLCICRKKLSFHGEFACVGDFVELEEIDWDRKRATICSIKPRLNLIERPLVANLTDLLVVLSATEPKFDFDQATRFLITAEKENIRVSLIITKSDIVNRNELENIINRIECWGYKPHVISTKTGEGIEELINNFIDYTLAVLCGPSGVGKSSFLKFLLPNEQFLVSAVSTKLLRGKNTTRNVQLYRLKENLIIADTPGFNRPELNIKPNKLSLLFPEIRFLLKNKYCKFRNCLHRDEPGCMLDKNWERYPFYLSLLDEMLNHP